MPTNYIIVLDSYFNLTNKSNLIDRLQYITIFCLFGSCLLFWATLYIYLTMMQNCINTYYVTMTTSLSSVT